MANDAQNSATPGTTSGAYRYVRRGSPLSTYLGFLLAMSILGIFLQLSVWDRMAARTPSGELWILGAVMLLRPVCLVGIWFWSRIGVIAYIAVTGVYVTLVAIIGFSNGIFGILSPVILIILLREKWKFMRWGFSRRSRRVYNDEEE